MQNQISILAPNTDESTNLEIDYNNRIVYILDEIFNDTPGDLLLRFNKLLEKDSTKPINLIISTTGGDLYGMFGVIDVIKAMPVPVNTYALGVAMSSGFVIVACGTGKRYAFPNTTFMTHGIQTSTNGDNDLLQINAAHLKVLTDKVVKLMAAHTKKPASFWKAKEKGTTYMTANEALNAGIVDEIISTPYFYDQAKQTDSKEA